MAWSVVCPSGVVHRAGVRTLDEAREIRDDASWVCACARRGHRVVNEETGEEYLRTDNRNMGVYRCGVCGEVGHTRRRCPASIEVEVVHVLAGERHAGGHPKWFPHDGGLAVTCPDGHLAAVVEHADPGPTLVVCRECGWQALVALDSAALDDEAAH